MSCNQSFALPTVVAEVHGSPSRKTSLATSHAQDFENCTVREKLKPIFVFWIYPYVFLEKQITDFSTHP